MDDTAAPAEKRMRLRYAGTCRICNSALSAKAEAIYERATKTVRCLTHEQHGPETTTNVDSGTAGSSARREFERRKAAREDRIRTKHPRLSGLILALSDEPQSTTAWDTGAVGEERLGSRLNASESETCRVLHDRRMPGSRANIDHLAVTPTGVYVIDAKRYQGPRSRPDSAQVRRRRLPDRSFGKAGFGVSEGVFAAARRVRVFLPDLAPEDHREVDAELAELLNRDRGPDTEARLGAVLGQRPATAMFLDAVLGDEPLFRPPRVVEQQLREAGFPPLPGSHVPPAADRFCCSAGDFEWFSPGVGSVVPSCPTHGELGLC